MKTYQNDSLTGDEVFTVGDVVKGKDTNYPHLDALGDVGLIKDKTGFTLCKYNVIALYFDEKTNEVLKVDIQIIEATTKVLPSADAECVMHKNKIPCNRCLALEKSNY